MVAAPLSEGQPMASTVPFDVHHERYEQWFERHSAAYLSELLALRPFVPWQGRGLEIVNAEVGSSSRI
jgi:hypothetical protein